MLYQTDAAAIRPLHEWTGTFEHLWKNQLNRIKERAERTSQLNTNPTTNPTTNKEKP
jgi:hypothetical protein